MTTLARLPRGVVGILVNQICQHKNEEVKSMSNEKKEISEKARQNLERNAQIRENKDEDSKYAKIQSGEKVVWMFNAENVEPVEQEFNGRKVQKFQYAIIDPNKPNQERYWTANKMTSEQIDAFLNEGQTLLKIQRIGSGTDTRYNIMAA
jgi:hypothetical protein